MRLLGLATLACLAIACGGTDHATANVRVDTLPGGITRTISSGPIERGRWSLVAARDIQPPEDDEAEIINPADLALADDGSLLVRDTRPAHVKVFDPRGTLVRRLGREGRGPGEFTSGYLAVRGDTAVVQDPQNGRAVFFNWRTGAVIGERRTACCYFHPIRFDALGRAVVWTTQSPPDTTLRNTQGFVRFPLVGDVADTLFAVERQGTPPTRPWLVREGGSLRMAVTVPLQPRAHFAVDPIGGFITGWSGEYLLRSTRDGRDTVALFGRPVTPEAVSAAEKQQIVERELATHGQSNPSGVTAQVLRAALDPAQIPDSRPAYENFTVDGAGRRWVRLVERDTTRIAFDLFDADGRWLDTVALPATDWPRSPWSSVAWSATAAAVVLEGQDGRPFVRIYRIVRR